jgi:predicted DNA-binding transcriptional regulator AlpA
MIRKLRKSAVAERYGGVNTRTIDRWLLDPALKFPKPIYIGRSPLWDEAELEAWERDRARPSRPASQTQGLETGRA